MPEISLPALPGMATGRTYLVTYRRTDPELGTVPGSGTAVYDGPDEATGKHKFTATGGGYTFFLAADEITTMSPR